MRLLTDINVPSRLVAALREAGHEVTRAQELGFDGRPDDEILEWAVREGALLVTRDRDFHALSAVRLQLGGHHPGVAFLLPGATVDRYLPDLLLALAVYEPSDWPDRVHHFPL